ncbi:MAG TPA: styrene monooxygenase/indole monooxygenase family protein [Thermoanaerobaculia bacterium]|nr:styrene monooxygenase/indole monooxygenase family protein [Thermoanaerobaculia bacterium]
MRKIAIVGAGQAGMVLAFGLLDKGYDVTVLESRTAEQIEHGPILSTAMVFDQQLDTERRLGLHVWEGEAPVCNGMHATLRLPNGDIVLQVQGGLDETCQGVDARIKSSAWMRQFERRGGRLEIATVDPARLDHLAEAHDLVVVASGKGQLRDVFARDPERTLFDGPPRRLAALILKNVHEWEEVPYTPLKFQFCMDAGDYFAIPFYSWSGPCRGVVFEAPPGSFMDRFGEVTTGEQALATAKAIIRELTPQDWPNYKDAELVDEGSWLKGAITPTVRKPVGRLASGRHVMALGDAAILNDPISGAGANDAVRMANRLLAGIVERGDRPFTADWMQGIFEAHYQEHGRHTMRFTKIMTEPMTDPAWKVLQAAARSPGVAHTFVNVYTDIQQSLGWLTDMDAADAVCDRHADELQGARFLTMAEARARFMPQSAAA